MGFYGGSFDPIHIGHLALAIELSEKQHLDEVFFCPAGLAPNKKHAKPLVSYAHRSRMVAEALLPFPSFTLIDLERDEETPSYTVDTLTLLQRRYPEIDLFLLLADEAAMTLPTWKEVEKLLTIATPLLARRSKEEPSLETLPPPIREKVLSGRAEIPLIEISSTQVRERIKKNLPCNHLIPEKVLDYIRKHQLYS